MAAFAEKAIFLWDCSVIEGGDPAKITDLLVKANYQGVFLHWQNLDNWRSHFSPALINGLKAAGLAVYGSAAVYGANPTIDGQQAGGIVNQFDLAGFVFDAEDPRYDSAGTANSNAVVMLLAYKSVTGKPCAWCWWPLLTSFDGKRPYHNGETLRAAMTVADVAMPMAYWDGSLPEAAVDYLNHSLEQWRKYTSKPVAPAGRAYTGDGSTPTAESIRAFEAQARALGSVGASWWSMQHALRLPGIWDALAGLPKFNGSNSGNPGETHMWKDNALGVVVDGTMDASFAQLKAEGASFVTIEAGVGFTPNPALAEQIAKARSAGLAVILQYTPFPAMEDYTQQGIADAQVVFLRNQIAGKVFHGLVISIERYWTGEGTEESGKPKATDMNISTVASTLMNTFAHELGSKAIPVMIRTNDNFVQSYCKSLGSGWTDKFGFFLADWRYRTRAADGTWSVYTPYLPTPTPVASLAALRAACPPDNAKNPLVPGNSPQLKFWEFSGDRFELPYIKGWDGKPKTVKTVIFNGDQAACFTWLNVQGTTPPPDDPGTGDDPGGDTPGGTTDLTPVLEAVRGLAAQVTALSSQMAGVSGQLTGLQTSVEQIRKHFAG